MLEREFKFECPVKHFFYSDSTVVLGYISNSTRRYQLFVANRVGVIQSLTSVSQWSHVAGKQNPADLASRGCLPTVLPQSFWFTGPSFLHDPGSMSYSPLYYPLVEKDENVRKVVTTCAVTSSSNFFQESLSHISDYSRLLRVVALCLKWVKSFRSQTRIERDVFQILMTLNFVL